MARSTRNQPFCWQEKKILRLLEKLFSGNELAKYRNLYLTVTQIDSDFNGRDIQYYTRTIHKYSGLSKQWIPKGLKKIEEIGIIKLEENREHGRYIGKKIIFTPENIKEDFEEQSDVKPEKHTTSTNSEKSTNGKSTNGKLDLLEDSLLKEESIVKENKNNIVHLTCTSYFSSFEDLEPELQNLVTNYEELYIQKTRYSHPRVTQSESNIVVENIDKFLELGGNFITLYKVIYNFFSKDLRYYNIKHCMSEPNLMMQLHKDGVLDADQVFNVEGKFELQV